MPELSAHDLSWCVRRLDSRVAKFVRDNAAAAFVAGGYIRSTIAREPVADVDVFISSAVKLEDHLRSLLGTPEIDERKVHRTANAVTIRWTPRVQIIHRWTFRDAADAIERFDFTIARAAIWFDGSAWRSVCDDAYYADLAARRVVYCSPQREEEPGGSLLRLLKFVRRGYTAPVESVAAILARVTADLPAGSEADRAAAIVTRLREVDPADPAQPSSAGTVAEDEEVDF